MKLPIIDSTLKNMKLYLALSRTPHGVLDLATPIVAMLLWLDGFPPFSVVLLGLVTVFSGYTAVYALNDIADYKTDKEIFGKGVKKEITNYLDAVFVRHPVAQGLLTLPQAYAWTAFWGGLAFLGAWMLNPFCALLLIVGAVLEIIYCKLLRITHLRVLINGLVKCIGPLAAVFAVDPLPELWFVGLLMLWVFTWEVGGQNIPADWHDIEEDRTQGARTVPVVLGEKNASRLALGCLVCTLAVSVPLFTMAPLGMNPILMLVALYWGWRLTARPARLLEQSRERQDASGLFNSASRYPAAMLAVVLLSVIF